MSNTFITFTKGVVTGVVVGTTLSMVTGSMIRPASPLKRGAGKVLKTVGTALDGLNQMIR